MNKKQNKAEVNSEVLKKNKRNIVEVKCAFCNGTGKDPFELLSKLSVCQVCFGKGKIKIEGAAVKCNFCGGTGISPYTTSRLHCLACGGKGVVTKIDPSKKCSKCGGTGIYPRRPHPVVCPKCKGQGIVAE